MGRARSQPAAFLLGGQLVHGGVGVWIEGKVTSALPLNLLNSSLWLVIPCCLLRTVSGVTLGPGA